MEKKTLGIIGWGLFIPPQSSVEEVVTKAGSNASDYLQYGWKNICIAEKNDHPNSMSIKALQRALQNTNVQASTLKLIISVGETHNFLGTPTSTSLMKQFQTPPTCVGFDINQNCIALPTALEIAKNWLQSNEGGYAAIICAEKWTDTVNKADKNEEINWGFSDGASAIIVGMNVPNKIKLHYYKSTFHTKCELNGFLQRKFGGTEYPIAAANENQMMRIPSTVSHEKIFSNYFEGFQTVISSIQKLYKDSPQWVACTQTSPGTISMLSYWTKVSTENIASTGHTYGHLGCSDIAVGLEDLFAKNKLKGPGLIVSSSPTGWNAAYLVAAEDL